MFGMLDMIDDDDDDYYYYHHLNKGITKIKKIVYTIFINILTNSKYNNIYYIYI